MTILKTVTNFLHQHFDRWSADFIMTDFQFQTSISKLSQTWLSCEFPSSRFMLLFFLIHKVAYETRYLARTVNVSTSVKLEDHWKHWQERKSIAKKWKTLPGAFTRAEKKRRAARITNNHQTNKSAIMDHVCNKNQAIDWDSVKVTDQESNKTLRPKVWSETKPNLLLRPKFETKPKLLPTFA